MGNKLRDFWLFWVCVLNFRFLCFVIGSSCLIKARGHIPTFFDVLELSKSSPNMDSWTPSLHISTFQKSQKHVLQSMIPHMLESIFQHVRKLFLVGPKQLVSPSVLNKKRNLRWCAWPAGWPNPHEIPSGTSTQSVTPSKIRTKSSQIKRKSHEAPEFHSEITLKSFACLRLGHAKEGQGKQHFR